MLFSSPCIFLALTYPNKLLQVFSILYLLDLVWSLPWHFWMFCTFWTFGHFRTLFILTFNLPAFLDLSDIQWFQVPLGLKITFFSTSANNLYLIGGGETEILEQHGHCISLSHNLRQILLPRQKVGQSQMSGSSLMCATKRQVLCAFARASAPSSGLTVRPKHPAAPIASQSHPQRTLPWGRWRWTEKC